ncbi:MAG: hypothetical protein GY854_28730 [Deltaproteobacteria bacterium]|nr:hypothetical protein [Deltaproteobacteria bacterium]
MKIIIGSVFVLAIGCAPYTPVQGENKLTSRTMKKQPNNQDSQLVSPVLNCRIPSGLIENPGATIGAPRLIGTSENIRITTQRVGLTLGQNGEMWVTVDQVLENTGKSKEVAIVGYGWRVPNVSNPLPLPARNIEFESSSEEATIHQCMIPGPQRMVKPFTDVAHWTKVPVKPGEQFNVTSAYLATAKQASKPVTLFGYHDRFALNWKNYAWPYTQADEYVAIADRLKTFHSRFTLIPAEQTQIIIRSETGDEWLRGMSHEQNTQKERTRGTYAWNFSRDTLPAEVEFEYVPGLPIDEELAVFNLIAKARPWDLRAHVRLIDLHRFAGDASERVKIIRSLLSKWDKNAKSQLLVAGNDVRAAAYVALVRALKETGRHKKAKEAANNGIALIDRLASESKRRARELSSLARQWLNEKR